MIRTHYLDKLKGARELLSSPEANQSSFSLALIKVHSTLEDYLREAIDLANAHRGIESRLVGDTTVQWRELASLAEQAGLLTPRQRQTALDKNKLRIGIAHGDDVTVERIDVEAYCLFVEAIIERGQAQKPPAQRSRQPSEAPPASRKATPPPPTAPAAAPARPAATPRERSAPRQASAPRSAPPSSRTAQAGRPQPPGGVITLALAILLVLVLLAAFTYFSRTPPPPQDIVTPGPLPTLMRGG
jgi:hypothetical protein